MHDALTRREFVLAASAALGAVLAGDAVAAPAQPRRVQTILFQGDSITDASRNRTVLEPNVARALGTGYPLLIASELLRDSPERGYRFINRGISGNKVPDLAQRWLGDALALAPDVLSILIGVNDY